MRSIISRTAFLSVLTLFFALGARAVDPPVRDNAEMFKPETVEKANALIKQIKADYGKELVVETFATIPDDRKSDWETAKDDAQKRSAFFTKWLEDRAHTLEVKGVYVLICKQPGHVEVRAGQQTRQKAFTRQNQDKLRDILVQGLKAEKPDETLITAVEYFRDTLKANLGGKADVAGAAQNERFGYNPGDSGSGGSGMPARGSGSSPPVSAPPGNVPANVPHRISIMWIVIVIIGAIVLVRILSSIGRRNNGGGPGYGPGPGPGYGNQGYGAPGYGGYGGGGGGGFFRGILGGMLGGAAGSYMYDKFSHRDAGQTPTPGQGGYVPPADDGGSSGGDFGPSSSGGGEDFSGGGSSGGDFGSSDSGFSGGGDSGSSGGDSGGSSGGDF